MARGLDANVPLTRVARALKLAGFSFVARYFKQSRNALSRPEAEALSRAGLSIVSVVERGFPISGGYFNRDRGIQDGLWAHNFAHQIGQPTRSAIYFAVDYDADSSDIQNRILDYFQGIQSAFAKSAKAGFPDYAIGAYGSGLTCATLLHKQAVSHTWLAQSMGWRGSRIFSEWNIKQGRGTTVLGVSIDTDVSRDNGGGWRLEGLKC